MPNADTTPRTPGLEERLRDAADHSDGRNADPSILNLLDEASDEIAHLRDDLEDQRERTRRAAGDAWDFGQQLMQMRAERATLHSAICEAVAALNTGENWRASDVLRRALVDYADRALNPEGADHV